MEEIIYQRNYSEYKQELRTELEKTSEGFVRIGYLLKVARDTEILVGSGYKDYLDFANGEFGLDKSMVSRFIRINDRFSEEGNSDRLLEQYKGFGYAKLAIMLRIPEVITEELSPEYTKAEIQEIKDHIDEERNKTEVQHFEENMDVIMNPPTDSLLVRVLKAIGEENTELYIKIWDFFTENTEWDGLKDIFKPLDQMTYVVRVPGEGKIILIVKEDGAALTIARTETKTNHSWDEIKAAWAESMECGDEQGNTFINAKAAYEYTYGKPIEEIPEVAPVQPKRVEAPKVEKPKKEEKPEKNKYQVEVEEYHKKQEEQKAKEEAAGVSPEAETAEEPVVVEEAVAIPIEEEPEEPKSKLDPATIRGYKAGLSSDIRALERMLNNNQHRAFKTKLEVMLNTINRIIDAEEV